MTDATPASTTKLSTSGVVNDLNTILGLIGRLNPVVAALPEVIGLIEAAISTFSNEDKNTVQAAYQQRMKATDLSHAQTQEALSEAAAKDGTGDPAESSPKGGGQ